jgi:glyoxylase-like metal-dependent hydrolase (beta-lactamase superfamily II)
MRLHTIDLNFQGLAHTIASYIIESSDGLIMIETGPATVIPHLVDGLRAIGFRPKDVRHVFVTHIHFDHAGATGWWAQQGAHVYVHHVGAPHLQDPSRLVHSASRIYGDDMERLWGELIPISADKITPLHDGDVVTMGDVSLTAWDTPGHAWHHHTYVLGNMAFTGDVAAVRLANSQWISIPAPPPEFKLEVWHRSLDRLEDANFHCIYPTHFGPVRRVAPHLKRVRQALDQATEFVRLRLEAGLSRDLIVTQYRLWNREQATTLGMNDAEFDQYELANPLFMSVDGIMRYWQKRWQRERG